MKNVKYLVFIFILLFINVFYVHASCTDDEINALKEEVKKIKITYKHLGEVELDEGRIYYNYFKLNASNLSDDFYVLLSKNEYKLIPLNGKIETTVFSGNWDFHVYSNNCEEKIETIPIFIPTFNMYSLDPLCEGIDGDDFDLCGKYYEYYVGYDDFVQRVTRYRNIHSIGQNDEEEGLEKIVSNFIDNLIEFVVEYKLYFLVGLSILILVLIFVIIFRRRRKRGVLE